MKWSTISLILCVFGFLKEFRPSEPFVTDYLAGRWKNFTDQQVNQEIFPYGTYFYLSTLVFVFLLTDLLRYKPIIILCGASGAATYLVIRWGTTILHMQVVQFLYGLLLSTEVAYFTYMYAKVDKLHYEVVTSHTRGAFLLGKFSAGLVSQLMVSYDLMDYEQLNYLSLAALSIAAVWACFLPPVQQSIYFNRVDLLDSDVSSSLGSPASQNTLSTISDKAPIRVESPFYKKLKRAYGLLWADFVKAYTNKHVIRWSLWWAFATCGYYQALNYVQLVWKNAVEHNKIEDGTEMRIYNGAVEAIYTIISALVVFGVGNLRLNWPLLGEPILSVFSIIEGFLLIVSYLSYNLWVLYVSYVAFGVIYHSVITIASFEVAKHLSEDSYGLIFGVNTFVALLLQSLFTFVAIDKSALNLDIKNQFLAYGSYFIILGIIFLLMSAFTISHYRKKNKPLKLWIKSTESIIESPSEVSL